MARYLYFETSQSAYQSVTELFDFVWPTSVALWNLRWQVGGLVNVVPEATADILNNRFVAGSGVHGANLRYACIEMTWPDQQRQFAKFLLIELIALFEGWLGKTLADIGYAQIEKQFQFPTRTKKGGSQEGVGAALARLKATPSVMTQSAFYRKLTSHPKNSIGAIEAMLITFRCFKECRNALMHNNGKANAKVYDAWKAYTALSVADLRVKEMPLCPAVVPDELIALSLRGVVGFADVILRLIATLDAEFACTSNAEREFRSRWSKKFATRPTLKTKDRVKREQQISHLVHSMGFPRPAKVAVVEQFLQSNHLVG